jgi:hypothetical protein
LRIYSSIDLKLDGAARPINQRANCGYLCTLCVDKALPTESRVNGHNENQVDFFQHSLDQ